MARFPDVLTVGELAARSGVQASALRYYESLGLISAARSAGGQRRYPRTVLRRVAVIRAARQVGVPLEEIRTALATLPHDRTPTRADWARLSRVWRTRLDRQIAQLQRLRDDLSGCIGCGCLSLRRCRLYNPDDQLGAAGSGPRLLLDE